VERGGPKAGQIGRFLHVSVFWRFFRRVAGERDTKRPCFGVLVAVSGESCRREREGEEEEREYGMKIDLTVEK